MRLHPSVNFFGAQRLFITGARTCFDLGDGNARIERCKCAGKRLYDGKGLIASGRVPITNATRLTTGSYLASGVTRAGQLDLTG